MYCPSCGKQIEDNFQNCPFCGTNVTPPAPQPAPQPEVQQNQQFAPPQAQYAPPQGQYTPPPYQNNPQPGVYPGAAQPNFNAGQNADMPPKNVSFGEAIKLFFANYANFNGRATKSEYWWAFLFNILVSFAIGWIPVIGQIIAVGLLIPGISVAVRRLHDTGKAWTYIFMALIPIAGFIIILVQYCKDSDGDNQWGPARRN